MRRDNKPGPALKNICRKSAEQGVIMSTAIEVKLFFNFRSPYCYLASKTLWPILEQYNTRLTWYPVGGWDLRSPPERAKNKMPLARQDIARFARRMQIPLNPPPAETNPNLAAADRKSTRLNSSHITISYAVFCLKKKK